MVSEHRVPADLAPARAADWFRQWAAEAGREPLHIVLPAAGSLGTTVRVLLAAGIAARTRRGLRTEIRGSEEAKRALDGLRPVRDLRQAREQADEQSREAERELEGVSPSPLRMARFVFEELGANVVQRSGAAETGFGLLRTDPRTRSIGLAFADAGVGFLASLQRNPELAGRIQDDGEALQLALSKGLIGLGLLQDFADRIAGELWIASGSALLRRRSTAGVRANTVQPIASWAGSWIALEARLG